MCFLKYVSRSRFTKSKDMYIYTLSFNEYLKFLKNDSTNLHSYHLQVRVQASLHCYQHLVLTVLILANLVVHGSNSL